MTDQLILDRGQWPGVTTATDAAHQIGAVGWMAYVGGRSLFFPPWPADGIKGLMDAGLGVLPVYALASPLTQTQGRRDGETAVGLAQAAGVAGGSLIMLDVEPDFYRGNPAGCLAYANAWQDAVQAGNYRSCMYSTAAFLNAFQSAPPSADAVIVARFPQPGVIWGPPSTDQIPDAQPSWPPARGWQYTNEVIIAGINVDLSVINFSLAGGDDLTPDEHQTLYDINTRTALLYNALFYGNEGPPGNKPLVQAQATADGLAKIEQMISNLQVPPANLKPVLDAIAALKADLDSLTLKKV